MDLAGIARDGDRIRNCGTYLEYASDWDGTVRKLIGANFCSIRLCPMCSWRRARIRAWHLSQVMDKLEQEQEQAYIYLTLTLRNVRGLDGGLALRDAIRRLTGAWRRMTHGVYDSRGRWKGTDAAEQFARSVNGWYRAIEVTRHGYGGQYMYHPHMHVVLAVDQDYFGSAGRLNGKWIDVIGKDGKMGWVEMWRDAASLGYAPSVDVRTTYDRDGGKGGYAQVLEAAKYTVKDSDYIAASLPDDRAARIVDDYYHALRRVRLVASGGNIHEMEQRLKYADPDDTGDLIHSDDDKIRDDLLTMLEVYRWSMGTSAYLLTEREPLPEDYMRKRDERNRARQHDRAVQRRVDQRMREERAARRKADKDMQGGG